MTRVWGRDGRSSQSIGYGRGKARRLQGRVHEISRYYSVEYGKVARAWVSYGKSRESTGFGTEKLARVRLGYVKCP